MRVVDGLAVFLILGASPAWAQTAKTTVLLARTAHTPAQSTLATQLADLTALNSIKR